MDSQKLIDAAHEGDIQMLNKLVQENPYVVNDISFVSSAESLVHIATKAGQVNFVIELMKHNHKLARDLNGDGFRPLDIAAILGNVEILKVLLRADPELCLLKGKDRKTALHYAAIKGRVEAIDQLVSSSPDSIKDITVHGETALHLAVKSYQVDAFKALVKWLEIHHHLPAIINCGDINGNTVLHLAASTKQHEIIELLLTGTKICSTVDVNITNAKCLAAIDVFDMVIENSADFHTREILRHAGAVKDVADNKADSKASVYQAKSQHKTAGSSLELPKDWFKYFKFQIQRDSPSDARNALLVVAALIATVTFQAGVTPPTGVLDTPNNNQPTSPNSARNGPPPPPKFGPGAVSAFAAASAIFGSHTTTFLFLFANSLGLTASLSIIIYLTGGFPFQRELLISIFAMMFSYGFSISSILKGNEKDKEVGGYLILTVAFILPFLVRWLPIWGRKARRKCREKCSRRALLPIERR